MKFTKINSTNKEEFNVYINGKKTKAYKGDTIASTLLLNNCLSFKKSSKLGESRGLLCGMGVCYECLVTVNEVTKQQACITPVEEGMRIETNEH